MAKNEVQKDKEKKTHLIQILLFYFFEICFFHEIFNNELFFLLKIISKIFFLQSLEAE